MGKHDQYTEIKSYPAEVGPNQIDIAGVPYRPAKLKKIELDRLVNLLGKEPLEKAPAQQ